MSNFVGHPALPLAGRGNPHDKVADPPHRTASGGQHAVDPDGVLDAVARPEAARLHGPRGVLYPSLEALDVRLDVSGRILGVRRQCSHLVDYHGKAVTPLASLCGSDDGVEGERVGLFGDVLDHCQHRVDAGGSLGQLLGALGVTLHFLCQLAGHLDGRFHHVGILTRLPADVIGHLRDTLGVARHLVDDTARPRCGNVDLIHRRVFAVD